MRSISNLTSPALTEARQIVGNLDADHSRGLRLLAWNTLKSARGQTLCQRRLTAEPTGTGRA